MKDTFIEIVIIFSVSTLFYYPFKIAHFYFGPFEVQSYFVIGVVAGILAETIIKIRQLNRLEKMVKKLEGKCGGCN